MGVGKRVRRGHAAVAAVSVEWAGKRAGGSRQFNTGLQGGRQGAGTSKGGQPGQWEV